jgi:cytoskeletal protein RodZ
MAVPRPSGGIGAALRGARERRGLSLRQVAATTKISVSVLEALEREDISRLPGGIFGRAFVRSYAQEVGLDPEDIIREFIAQFPTDTVTAGHPTARPREDREAADSAERAAWTMGRLALASVPLVALVLYATGAGRSGVPEATPSSAVQAQHEPPASEPALVPAQSVVAAPVEIAADGPLSIAVTASGPCWVQVEVDGRVVLERELRPGDRELFEIDEAFSITAGNAGALSLSVNGREVRSLGGSGRVVTVNLTRDNFRDFLVEP